jgi:hypothetical protein
MIVLFRRIRRNLMKQGGVSRYLLYATGETLLVVIGILIALQINNWNEQNKDRAYELTMLREVRDALEVDHASLLEIIPYLEQVLTSIRELVTMKNDRSYPVDTLDHHLRIVRNYGNTLTVNESPFEALKSGGLDRISNAEIRSELSTLYGFTLKNADEWINQVLRVELFKKSELAAELFDIAMVVDDSDNVVPQIPSQDPDALLDHPTFERFLYASEWPLPRTLLLLRALRDQMAELIQEIDAELER